MPLYEYRCTGCRLTTEGMYSASNFPREVACPSCGEVAVKIISLPQRPIVDNTDRQGFNVGAGRRFSNKGEIREYCRQNNVVDVGTEGESRMRSEMASVRAEKEAAR